MSVLSMSWMMGRSGSVDVAADLAGLLVRAARARARSATGASRISATRLQTVGAGGDQVLDATVVGLQLERA